MAVDTQTKRRSVQAYTLGLMRPVPDSSIDTGDRAISAWLYSGFDYEVIVVLANVVAPKVCGGWRRGLEFRAGPGVYSIPVGDNDATYQWYKNGVAVATGHRYSPGRGSIGSTVHFTETIGALTTLSDQVLITRSVYYGYWG